MGKRSSVTFVSCRQTTSGPSWVSQGPSVSRRTRSEFTFQVAIRSMSSPQRANPHPGREAWGLPVLTTGACLGARLHVTGESPVRGIPDIRRLLHHGLNHAVL